MKLKLDDYTIGKLRGKKIQVKIEVNIAHFLDKAQGSLITGPIIFNNFVQFGHSRPSDELMAHVTTNLAIVHEKASEVLVTSLSLEASLNFRDYVRSLFGRLDQDAYRVPLNIASMRLDGAFGKAAHYKT